MSKTALLVMDVQPSIVSMLGDKKDAYLKLVQSAVVYARNNKIPVIFVVVRFRHDFPEVSINNKSFSKIKESPSIQLVESSPDAQPAIESLEQDIVVTKRRVSAFTGSDLAVVLRSLQVSELVLCGIATSGVVLSTVREAADMDFEITVLEDACFDSDPEVHQLLTTKVFPRQADVVSVDDWLKRQK